MEAQGHIHLQARAGSLSLILTEIENTEMRAEAFTSARVD